MKRLLLIGALTAVAALLVGACGGDDDGDGGGDSGEASSEDPILIGISAAQTGVLAPFDLQSGQLFQQRIDEINEEGGVLGRQIEVEWLDTGSDKPAAATNARELLDRGAVAIIATCDFDFSFPAIDTAAKQEVPAIALCASSPKVATPAIVSEYGGSMGLGSDAEGAAMAEWMRSENPEWERAYVFRDNSIEYSKDTADYFRARFEELGGQICGDDTFVGSPDLDLSSQITRLRGSVDGCDVIYDGSWQPFGSQLIRAIRSAGIDVPITSNASVNGTQIRQVGGKVSDFYALGFACLPTYCEGTQSPSVRQVAESFEANQGDPIAHHYALPGYSLADALVEAIETAGSTDGTEVANALFSGDLTVDFFGREMTFTPECHRPQPAVYSIEQWTNGKNEQIDEWTVEEIPELDEGNPCEGEPVGP